MKRSSYILCIINHSSNVIHQQLVNNSTVDCPCYCATVMQVIRGNLELFRCCYCFVKILPIILYDFIFTLRAQLCCSIDAQVQRMGLYHRYENIKATSGRHTEACMEYKNNTYQLHEIMNCFDKV